MDLAHLAQLPTEVSHKVLLNYDYDDIINACRLHPSLRDICGDRHFWELKIEKIPPEERQLLFEEAAEKGYTNFVLILLDDDNVDPAAWSNNAIIEAAKNGHTNIVKLLLKDGRADPSTSDNSPIKLAAKNGNREVIQLLLSDPRVDPTASEQYLFESSVRGGNTLLVEMLLKDGRVDPSVVNNRALTTAAMFGYYEIAKLLLSDRRVDPVSSDNWPVRIASQRGHAAIVQLLLQYPTVDPTEADNWAIKNTQTPAVMKVLFSWYCAHSNQLKSVIVHLPSDIIKTYLSFGLKFACYYNNYNNVEILMQRGAGTYQQSHYCERIARARNDDRMLRLLGLQ